MKSFHAAGTIDSGGFQLRYIIEGEGSPILVIGSALYDERVFSRARCVPRLVKRKDHRGNTHRGHRASVFLATLAR